MDPKARLNEKQGRCLVAFRVWKSVVQILSDTLVSVYLTRTLRLDITLLPGEVPTSTTPSSLFTALLPFRERSSLCSAQLFFRNPIGIRMKFTLLSCLFFSSISALGAPMRYRRHDKATTAIASSAVNDEIVTEVVTITIT